MPSLQSTSVVGGGVLPGSSFPQATCFDKRLLQDRQQYNNLIKEESRLQEMMAKVASSVFDSHKQSILAQLQQVDQTFAAAMQNIQERVSDCEVRLLQVHGEDAPATVQNFQREQLHSVQDSQTRVSECEAKLWSAAENRSQHQPVSDVQKGASKREADASATRHACKSSDVVEESLTTAGGAGIAAYEYSYEFKQSVWDLAMLIGMPHMHFLGSCWIGFLFVMNACMQLTLCLLINDFFTVRDIDHETVADMANWRIHSAHAWEFVDRRSFQSLAHRICSFDGSVVMSSGIAEVLGKISEYMPLSHDYQSMDPYLGRWLPHFEGVGVCMCLLAITIWLLMVGEDLEEVLSLTRALLPLPLGTTAVRKTGGRYEWCTTSWRRKMCCLVIVILKTIVAVSLGILGTLYLCFTIELRELLLNAAALQIVLDLDDIVFYALAPARARRILESMEPLPRSPSITLAGLNMRPVLVAWGIMMVLIFASLQVLEPQSGILQSARDELCSGNTNFITVQDPSGLMYATEVPLWEPHTERYSVLAMRELIRDQNAVHIGVTVGSLSAKAGGIAAGHFSMAGISQMSVKLVSEIVNVGCYDILPPPDHAMFQSRPAEVIRLIIEEASRLPIISCDSVKDFCSSDLSMGVRARQFCPETCGCAYPGSSLVLVGEDSGCSPTCLRTTRYQTVSSSRNCSDEVVNGTLLLNYIQGLQSYVAAAPADWQPDVRLMIARVRSEGCGSVITPWTPGALQYPWDDMCVESKSWFLQTLAFACPEACACRKRKLPSCPSSCQR